MEICDLVIDLNFGSTGKGLICGWLTDRYRYDTAVAAWGPNSGHTFIDALGRKLVVTMLPIAAHSPYCKAVCIGPGAVIDLPALKREVANAVKRWGFNGTIYVHPNACVLRTEHVADERRGSNIKIGSTMKGTGTAMIAKIRRDPDAYTSPLVADVPAEDWEATNGDATDIEVVVDERAYNAAIDDSERMLIEGAQGFSLGLHRHFWPYTTSREVTPLQIMSDCAVPMRLAREVRVIGTARTLPIRVANRFDADGKQVGTSGPPYPDQHELDWAELHLEPELTTVTKLPRRIFSYSKRQLTEAIRMCGPRYVFLNFCNYPIGDLVTEIRDDVAMAGSQVRWLGYGPCIGDIKDLLS